MEQGISNSVLLVGLCRDTNASKQEIFAPCAQLGGGGFRGSLTIIEIRRQGDRDVGPSRAEEVAKAEG